jgi:alpha-tubulin suppressor-like RCC1 family protein
VGGPVVQIVASMFRTCALLDTGKVRCWGRGYGGGLGYGNVESIGDDETPTRVDVGFLHTCVTLDTGKVRCWGRAGTGALGYGNIHDIGDDEAPALAGDVKLQ